MSELAQVLLVIAGAALFVIAWWAVSTWWQRDRARRRAEQWERERPAWREAERRLDIDMGRKPRDPD